MSPPTACRSAGRQSAEERPRPTRSHEVSPAWPAIALGFICAVIWLVAWLVGRRWRKWPAYIIGFPFFMIVLFFFFEEFSRLLPSNF